MLLMSLDKKKMPRICFIMYPLAKLRTGVCLSRETIYSRFIVTFVLFYKYFYSIQGFFPVWESCGDFKTSQDSV